MKITIHKSFEGTFDTEREKKRINKCFKGENKKRLLNLVSLVENKEWEKAFEELEDDWWTEYDEKDECSRQEYIGHLFDIKNTPDGFNVGCSYADLIYAMHYSSKNYSVKYE